MPSGVPGDRAAGDGGQADLQCGLAERRGHQSVPEVAAQLDGSQVFQLQVVQGHVPNIRGRDDDADRAAECARGGDVDEQLGRGRHFAAGNLVGRGRAEGVGHPAAEHGVVFVAHLRVCTGPEEADCQWIGH